MADLTKNILNVIVLKDLCKDESVDRVVSESISTSENSQSNNNRNLIYDSFSFSDLTDSDIETTIISDNIDFSQSNGREEAFLRASGQMSFVSDGHSYSSSAIDASGTIVVDSEGKKVNETTSSSIDFFIGDNVSVNHMGNYNIERVCGCYYGDIPINVDINDMNTLNIKIEYLKNGRWKECLFLRDSQAVSGRNTFIWLSSRQEGGNFYTKLRISIDNIVKSVTDKIYVKNLYVKPAIFSEFGGWDIIASGIIKPSGTFVPISYNGDTVNSVDFCFKQNLQDTKSLTIGRFYEENCDNVKIKNDILTLCDSDKLGFYSDIIEFNQNVSIKDMRINAYIEEGEVCDLLIRASTEAEGREALDKYEWTKYDDIDDIFLCKYLQYKIVLSGGAISIQEYEHGLLAVEGYSTSHAYSHSDFENKSYPYGPVTLDNINSSGNSIVRDSSDNFCQKFYGAIECDEDGVYTFATNSDDASDISIDGTVVCSWYGGHGTGSWRTGTIYLEKGMHDFVYYHEEVGGGQSWNAGWQKPSSSSIEIIPASAFFTPYFVEQYVDGPEIFDIMVSYIENDFDNKLSIDCYPTSFVYNSNRQWGEIVNFDEFSSFDYCNTLKALCQTTISDIVDMKRVVELGQFEMLGEHLPAISFRCADTLQDLSSESFSTPNGRYIFYPTKTARYLEWKIDFDEGEDINSLVLYPNANKFFEYDKSTSIVSTDEDVLWSYVAAEGKTIDYRVATMSEGEDELQNKQWYYHENMYRFIEASGAYFEWRTHDNTVSKKTIIGYGNSDRQFADTSPLTNCNGVLDVALFAYDDNVNRETIKPAKVGKLIWEDSVPNSSVQPSFRWKRPADDNISKYIVQITREANYQTIDDIDITTKTTQEELENCSSKDTSVIIENGEIKLNTTIPTEGEISYIFGDGSYQIWTDLEIDAFVNDSRLSSTLYFYYRVSDDLESWSDWKRVQKYDKFVEKSKYFELKFSFTYSYGDYFPSVRGFSIYSTSGEDKDIVIDNGTEYITYDVERPLNVNEYYFYRVKAFDEASFSYWSQTKIIYTSAVGVPLSPTNLVTEGQTEPTHIITFEPYFEWQFHDGDPGTDSQRHARVQVGSASGVWDMWDSGKVETPSGVRYENSVSDNTAPVLLHRGRDYYWRVRTWDNSSQNLAGPFSEVTTFRLNRLPTVPKPLRATD